VRWRRGQRDFEAEIEAHLALETDALIARGADPAEARATAHRAFGNVTATAERFYESRRWAWLETTARNLRYALRALRRHPAFTIVAVVTLAFGVGLNTSLFSFLYAIALRPLPVRDAGRMVNVYRDKTHILEARGSPLMLSYAEYLAFRDRNHTLAGLAIYRDENLSLGLATSVAVPAQLVSCNYFQTLAVRMIRGRPFAPDECAHIGAGDVAIISYAFWKRAFGGDSSIIGHTLTINQQRLTVIGVAEEGFDGVTLRPAALWIPITMHPALTHGRDSILVREASWLSAVGRLRPGATREQALADLSTIARQRDALVPDQRSTIYVSPGSYAERPDFFRDNVVIVASTVGIATLILLMACANVMNLLLARAGARRREIGIRLSLGASRQQLIAQLMTESLMLALLGGAAGLAIACYVPRLMLAAVPQNGLRLDFTPDLHVFGCALALSIGAALVFGFVPALQATSPALASALRNEGPMQVRRIRASTVRNAIVGVQIAGSAALLVIAGLFVRSIVNAQMLDPGFTTEHVLTVSLDLQHQGYDSARAAIVYRTLHDRLAALPGVESVGLARSVPLAIGWMNTITIDDPDPGVTVRPRQTWMNGVSADYFPTMGVSIVKGHMADDVEAWSAAERPVVVSEATERLFWPKTGALGKRFHAGADRFIVTGVAKDVRNRSLDHIDPTFVYVAANPGDPAGLKLLVRGSGPLAPIERAIPPLVHAIDPNVVVNMAPYGKTLARVLRPTITTAWLAAVMGTLAALLAVIGVYGVVSYSVSERTREMGIRIALGAQRGTIIRLILRQGFATVIAGLLAGLALAAGVSRVIHGMLYGVSSLDPVAFLGVIGALLAAAALAMYTPARRATKVDPAVTLRVD
jgi:predicted permease